MLDKEKTCCFTGHRKLPRHKIQDILVCLNQEIDKLIAQGVTHFISGGAQGFDTLAACLILAKKEMGRNIRLTLALPCKNQDAFWNQTQKNLYQNLLKQADEVLYVSESYTPHCMKKRNQHMVALSQYCICALQREKSGTGQTVRLAYKRGLHVIHTL